MLRARDDIEAIEGNVSLWKCSDVGFSAAVGG
jgi:hypothetical protein